jgi:flagellar biosynthesis protein FlhG
VRDQAHDLRVIGLSARPDDPEPEGPLAVVIGSGKGGVGKSVLGVMLAAAFARAGRRTLLLDGAQNQGNLHILLGVRPAAPLSVLLAGEVRPEDLLVPVTGNLSLLPADSGDEALYTLGAIDRARLHRRLSTLYDAFDAVVIDGGSGIDSVVRAGGIRASRLAVVATPEPASLADAYALLKIVNLQVPSLPIEVMVNRVGADEEGQAVFDRLHLAAERFLRRELGYLGCVPEDESLWQGARRPGALLETRIGAIDAIAVRLELREAEGRGGGCASLTETRGQGT